MAKLNARSIVKISTTNFSFLRIQDGILPFFEKPSDEFEKSTEICEERMNAINLFSLFTANIIKEKVIFTR